MICPNCGSDIPQGAFCPNCGVSFTNQAQPQATYNPPQYAPAPPAPPLAWFKFLIYFALFASGVLNIIAGFLSLTGGKYGIFAEAYYRYFDGLQIVDIIVGLASIALGVFAIYVRFRLAKFCADGPKMLFMLYIGAAAINVLSALLTVIIVNASTYGANVSIDYTSVITTIAVSVVMVAVNNVYFKKRAFMFVN